MVVKIDFGGGVGGGGGAAGTSAILFMSDAPALLELPPGLRALTEAEHEAKRLNDLRFEAKAK